MKCSNCGCTELDGVFRQSGVKSTVYNDRIKGDYNFKEEEYESQDKGYVYYCKKCSSCGTLEEKNRVTFEEDTECPRCKSRVVLLKNFIFNSKQDVRVEAECCNCGSSVNARGKFAEGLLEKFGLR